MKAGRKRHVVSIIRKPQELTSFGREKDPEIIFNIRCNVQIISASTFIAAGANLTSEYISILAKYDRRLVIDDVLLWNGNKYTTEMIKPDEKLVDMVITALRKNSE